MKTAKKNDPNVHLPEIQSLATLVRGHGIEVKFTQEPRDWLNPAASNTQPRPLILTVGEVTINVRDHREGAACLTAAAAVIAAIAPEDEDDTATGDGG